MLLRLCAEAYASGEGFSTNTNMLLCRPPKSQLHVVQHGWPFQLTDKYAGQTPLFFFFFKILPPSDNRRRHMWSLQLDGPTDTTTAEPEFPHNTQFWCWRAKNAQGGKQARSVRYMCQYTVASVTEVCVRMHLPLRNMASAETTQSAFESVMGKDRGLGKAVLWASSCVFARSFPM